MDPVNYVDPTGFYSVAISFEGSAGFIGGVQGGVTVAFDGSGAFIRYVEVGAHVETNVSAVGSVTVSIAPKMPDATGWAGFSWFSNGTIGGTGEPAFGRVGVGASSGYAFTSFTFGLGEGLIPGKITAGASWSAEVDRWVAGQYSMGGVSVNVNQETGTSTVSVAGQTMTINSDGSLNQ